MSTDSHLITKFTDINLIEKEESKPIDNREFRKGIFHFYFLNIHISLGIIGTLVKILEHIENIQMYVNYVSNSFYMT